MKIIIIINDDVGYDLDEETGMTFNQMIPFVIIGYLMLLCTYSIHTEFLKIYSPIRANTKKNQNNGNGFLKYNINLLELTFFPTNLRRHHNE